jgi:hypothetical protein
MDIVRNPDGTLVVPLQQVRHHASDDTDAGSPVDAAPAEAATHDGAGTAAPSPGAATTRVLHPGEGGYDEALAEWDHQQNPDRPPVVSTATGRQDAMTLVHAVATSPDHEVASAVAAIAHPEAGGEALRHVLVGGVHSVEDFATEVAEAEGGEPLSAHETTKIIGEVLTELDS